MTYQDFDLQIGERVGDGHALRVLRSPAGDGSGRWQPREKRERLGQRLELLAKAISEQGEAQRGGPEAMRHLAPPPAASPGVRPIQAATELAAALFGDLWQGEVGGLMRDSLRSQRPDGLRLRILLPRDHPELSWLVSLPWELLPHPYQEGFLALDPRTPVVRHLGVGGPCEPTPLTEPVGIVLATASPAALVHLALDRECRLIEDAWVRHGEVEVTPVTAVSLAELRKAVLDHPCHILHFMGHGDLDGAPGEGRLILEDDDGQPLPVTGRDVAVKLRGRMPRLRLVVLSACETARPPGLQPFASVAAHFLQAGVPAVVAMQFPVSDRAAEAFGAALHRRLAAGELLEAAVAEGRQAMHSLAPSSLEWLTPVLFLRCEPERFILASSASQPCRGELLRRYLAWELERSSEVPLPGRPEDGAVGSMPLTAIYAQLRPLAGDRDVPSEPQTLDEVMHRELAVLMLGEAGSGKTTLLRWLAARYAGSWGRERVVVPAPEVDPEADGGSVELGPARVPIFISLARFAATRGADPGMTLAAYVGRHLGHRTEATVTTARGEPIAPEALARALLDLLAVGQVVLLLDGLDEIPELAQRHDIAREIARFLDAWSPPLGEEKVDGRGGRELSDRSDRLQVVVTSRPHGEPAMALGPRFTRYTFQPLSQRARQGLRDALRRAGVSVDGEAPGPGSPGEAGAGELASTPWGVTLLATATRAGAQRQVELCERVLEGWIGRWQQRVSRLEGANGLEDGEALRLLAALAAEMREGADATTGRSGEIWFPGGREERELARVVGRDIGLLAPDGVGFVNSSLEEHLAARALMEDPRRSVERMRARLGELAWREPILRALGLLAADPEGGFEAVALDLIATPDSPATRVPRGALALGAALPELTRVPPRVAEALAKCLLDAWSALAAPLELSVPRQRLEAAFQALVANPLPEVTAGLDRALLGALRSSVPDRVMAAAALLLRLDRRSADLAEALAAAEESDGEAWGWPVAACLRHLGAVEPAALPRAPESLRASLSRCPELRERLLTDACWLRLVVGLGGGLAEDGTLAVDRIYRDPPLTPFLLRALESDWPASSLAPELWRLAADPLVGSSERTEALVALTLLGKPVLESLRSDDPVSARARSRLRGLARWLDEVAPIAASRALGALAAESAEGSLEGCVDGAAAILEAAPGSLSALSLAMAAEAFTEAARPVVLAEVWRTLAMGTDPHGLYNACVLLDTFGALLSEPPELLVRSLALAGARAPGAGVWASKPSNAATDSWAVAHALDTLAALPEPYGFVRAWALERLAPRLAAEGWRSEALVLALGSLSDRFEARARAVRNLLAAPPELAGEGLPVDADGWLQHSEPAAPLSRLLDQVEDPFQRLRAQLRLGDLYPRRRAALGLPAEARRRLRAEPSTAGITSADPLWAVRPVVPGGVAAVLDLSLLIQRLLKHMLTSGGDLSGEITRERAGEEPRPLTVEVALALERQLEAGDRVGATEILVRIGRPTKDALIVVRRWRNSSDVELRRLAHLLLAEAGSFGPQVVTHLVELLMDPEDCRRGRAALALHGDRSRRMGPQPTHHLEPGTVEALARAWLEVRHRQPAVAKILEWSFERLHHSEPEAIRSWRRSVVEGGADRAEAQVILSRMESLSPAAWPAFVEGLVEGPAEVRGALLTSLSVMLARGRVDAQKWSQALAELRRGDLELPQSDQFVLGGPEAVLESAASALKHVGGVAGEGSGSAVQAAEQRLATSTVGWAQILTLPEAFVAPTLAAVGSLRLASPRFEEQLRRAAARLERAPELLRLLVAWLEARLRRTGESCDLDRFLLGDLLALTAVAAERSPAAWRECASGLPLLEKLLADAVRCHGTFTGRRAALELLGHLGRITPRVLEALESALGDVVEVQSAVFEAARQFHQVDPDVFDRLGQDLRHPSAAYAFAVGRLLCGIALNPRLSAALRRQARVALETVVADPRAQRDLVLLGAEELAFHHRVYRLRSRGCLADAFAELLAEARGDGLFATEL